MTSAGSFPTQITGRVKQQTSRLCLIKFMWCHIKSIKKCSLMSSVCPLMRIKDIP